MIKKLSIELKTCLRICKDIGAIYGLWYLIYKIAYRLNNRAFKNSYFLKIRKWLYDKYFIRFTSSNSNSNYVDDTGIPKIIWMMWWQGEDEMPPVIKNCYYSVKRNCENARVILIDRNNYKEYLEVPDELIKKVNTKKMRICYLADYIRFKLLYLYGGMWLDASIFLDEPLRQEVWKRPFYTVRHGMDVELCLGKWSLFFIGGCKRLDFFRVMYELLEQYWISENVEITYFMTDCFIWLCYENIDSVRNMIDKVPINNLGVNGKKDNDTYVHKIDWRRC